MRLPETTNRIALLRTLLLMGGYLGIAFLAVRLEPGNAGAYLVAIGAGSLVFLISRWRNHVVTEIRLNRAAIQDATAMAALGVGVAEPCLPWSEAALSPKAMLRLLGTVQTGRVRTVVECGSGISTLVLARHFRLSGGGHVYALEHDRGWCELMREWLAQRLLQDHATVIYAPLERVELEGRSFLWYSLEAAKPVLALARIELLLVDGPPGQIGSLARYPALPLLRSRLGAGSVIVLDDAERPDETSIGRLWDEQLAGRAQRTERIGSLLEWRLGPER